MYTKDGYFTEPGWEPDIAGSWKHWKRTNNVLNGKVCMHIEGMDADALKDDPEAEPWFGGTIQFAEEYTYEDHETIYRTEKSYPTMKECIDDLEQWWSNLISKEFEALTKEEHGDEK